MTTYVVLQLTERGEWAKMELEIEAASTSSAIRAHVKEQQTKEGQEGTFVAIPRRSWQPVKVQIETALKFST